jgi:endonuclease/exonuclease/phosphatase family metal-dependent hydrolase
LPHRRRRQAIGLALSVISLLGLPAAASAAQAKPDVTVMSRNLYLGADIITAAAAKDLPDMEQRVQALHQTVLKTNFQQRAKAIVKEIKRTHPDLVGLQEVTQYRRGPDGVHDGKVNANEVILDWLSILNTEIRAQGLHYKAVSQQDEFDLEAPSAEGFDLRITLRNVILARTGKGAKVKVTKALHGTFTDQLTVPLQVGPVRLTRGYAAVDAKVAGKKFRFVDPHAEAYGPEIAANQIKELLEKAAASKKVPTILAGDFNSDPRADPKGAAAYNAAIAAGFKDTGKPAMTCCQIETVDNPVSTLDKWIDHILVRPKAKVLKSQIVGNHASDRIGGLWPSDHAGVVATLRLK